MRRWEGVSGGATDKAVPWAWALVALTLITWQSALGTYFAQDDFRWLLKATAADSTPAWAPRFLSMHLCVRAMVRLLGSNPVLFHAIGLTLLLASGLTLYLVLCRRVPQAGAAMAVALWLSSPALFVAMHWTSAVSDLLCAFFLVTSVLLLVDDRAHVRRLRWMALLAYSLALSSKEVAVGAAPVLAMLDWRTRDTAGRTRGALYLVLATLMAAAALGPLGVGSGQAYAASPRVVLQNLPAYMSAALFAGCALNSGSDFAWSRLMWVQVAGWLVLATWLALLIRRRSFGAWLGGLWFLGVLSPVLPLNRQFYFYYLFCALPGLCVSALLLASEVKHISWRRALAIGCALLIAAQVLAVHLRSRAVLPNAPLARDFVIRRAQIAHNALRDFGAQIAMSGQRVVLIGQQPVETSVGSTFTAESTDYDIDPYWDDNVWAALGEGEALRWRNPNLREVRYRRWLGPEFQEWTIATFGIDGHLRLQTYEGYSGVSSSDTSGSLAARLARADRFMMHRMFHAALQELTMAVRVRPEDANLQLNIGTLHAMMGDTVGAVRSIAAVVERFPHHAAARYNLGLLYWRTGRPAAALRAWEPLIAEHPQSDLVRAARGLVSGERR